MQKKSSTKVMDAVMEKTFSAGNISIPYAFVRSIKSRYIRIRIGAKGMRVTAPLRTAEKVVESFLESKSGWIIKHYSMFQSMKENEKVRTWQNGDTIMYKGEEYKIKVFTYPKKRTAIVFNEKEFEVYINEALSSPERDENIENAFRAWFIKQAGEIIGMRVAFFTGITGLKYNSFKIKEQKTRWGSCSKKGNLNFNWKLVMSPQWVLDYVVLHEVCHLRHLNHSKAFWEMVAKYCPDYKKAHEWLRKNKLQL